MSSDNKERTDGKCNEIDEARKGARQGARSAQGASLDDVAVSILRGHVAETAGRQLGPMPRLLSPSASYGRGQGAGAQVTVTRSYVPSVRVERRTFNAALNPIADGLIDCVMEAMRKREDELFFAAHEADCYEPGEPTVFDQMGNVVVRTLGEAQEQGRRVGVRW